MRSWSVWTRFRPRGRQGHRRQFTPTAHVAYRPAAIWRDQQGAAWLATAGPVHRSEDAAARAAPNVLAGALHAGAPVPAPTRLQNTAQVANRWHRRRDKHSWHHPKPMRPAWREIPYDVARYLVLDTLSALGSVAGYSIAGPAGMVTGYFAASIARGVVSGTVGVIRARATRRWEMRQERRHRASYSKDREQDVRLAGYDARITEVEAALARLARHVGCPAPDPAAARTQAEQQLTEQLSTVRQQQPSQPAPASASASASASAHHGREQQPRAPENPARYR